MRLRIKFTGKSEAISLPCHHNEMLQGIIYHYLNGYLAERLHANGIRDPESNRGLKFFTFSRLISAKKPIIDHQNNIIKFYFPLTWVIASPLQEFIVSLYNTLRKKGAIYFYTSDEPEKKTLQLLNVWLESLPLYKRPVLVETLSPISVYRTEEKENKNYTHYFSPSDPKFSDLIIMNLVRKYRTLTGNKLSLDEGAYIKPVKIPNRENILYFKDTIIKGWSGIFELSIPKELFPLAFSCGLGAKNSQGFGCISIWRGNP